MSITTEDIQGLVAKLEDAGLTSEEAAVFDALLDLAAAGVDQEVSGFGADIGGRIGGILGGAGLFSTHPAGTETVTGIFSASPREGLYSMHGAGTETFKPRG